MSHREPKLNDLARIEDALKLPKGYLVRTAGYVEVPTTTRQAIEADPSLEPALRKVVLAAYDSAVVLKGAHHGDERLSSSTVTLLAAEAARKVERVAEERYDREERVAAHSGRLDRLSDEDPAAVKREVDDMLGPEDS